MKKAEGILRQTGPEDYKGHYLMEGSDHTYSCTCGESFEDVGQGQFFAHLRALEKADRYELGPTAPPEEPMVEFKSGAIRSSKALRYDLIPVEGRRRLAERYTLGAEKYGDWNWQKGLKDPEYIKQFKAHLEAHWTAYLAEGCSKDDNLAAVAWGAFALMEVERVEREGKE